MKTESFITKQTIEMDTDSGTHIEIALPDYWKTAKDLNKSVVISSLDGIYSLDDLKVLQKAIEATIILIENDLVL